MNDLKFASRQLLKSPGFTAVAVLTLALGIGANTVVFSVAKAILFRPLGIEAPEEVVWLNLADQRTGKTREEFSFMDWTDLRAQARSFEQLALVSWPGVTWEEGDQVEHLTSLVVTPSIFEVLRVRPVLGRSLNQSDAEPSAAPVAMISHEFWQTRFAGNPNILGQTLRLDEKARTVVGVLPARLEFPLGHAPAAASGATIYAGVHDVWLPLRLEGEDRTARGNRMHWLIGRLRPGVRANHVRVELATLARRWAEIGETRGFRWELLDRQQLKELVPIAGDNAIGGTYLHFGGHANPQRTVQAYAWALQDHGGRILQHTTVTGLTRRGGRVTAIETTRGSFGADTVIVAAGPQTGLFADMLGILLPLAPARVEMIATEPLPLMRHGGVAGNGLYGRQTLRGNLVYGGGPHEWINVPDMAAPDHPNTPLVRNLARRLAELLPGAAHLRVIRSWGGVVENTPDGLPVIDRLASPDNVVVATMSSVGFGLSPAVGKALSELVIHGRCLFGDLSALALSRFADTPPDWRERAGWISAAPVEIATGGDR